MRLALFVCRPAPGLFAVPTPLSRLPGGSKNPTYVTSERSQQLTRLRVQSLGISPTNGYFDVLLTVHLSIILVINQLDAQILVL
jgi:hypothetical protein